MRQHFYVATTVREVPGCCALGPQAVRKAGTGSFDPTRISFAATRKIPERRSQRHLVAQAMHKMRANFQADVIGYVEVVGRRRAKYRILDLFRV